ncbi:MAG: Uma2 family endonuclease [Gluconacetobacter diazotrophicus]|nr:Uma2 family endonuclease [Gluconacetobacter diazotrophicus]
MAMVDLLELPEVRRLVPRISVKQYRRMPEYTPSGRRTELLRGIVIERIGKSALHASLLRFLFRLVQAALVGTEWLVLKEDPITLADSEPEPDISVVQGEERATGAPTRERRGW